MKNRRKIINDPVHGFITMPSDFLYDVVQHPYFQRLGRVKQLGLTYMVYPGAQHTRFQHSLGAMHLMDEAVAQLRLKGNLITEEEAQGALLAILLHDLGHAPFSHVLEDAFADGVTHEHISLAMMEQMNREMGGKLDVAIAIFKNEYPKMFLHQLVSSQLDMDRLDYLMRDSFFTGVVEGAVGTDRIINMLDVADDQLVVEAKGIYSIEKFLIARRIMYWQVYFHKASVAAEQVLLNLLRRAKELALNGTELFASPQLRFFLYNRVTKADFEKGGEALLHFAMMDDSDIVCALKVWEQHPDRIISMLSKCLINRRLFKVEVNDSPMTVEKRTEVTRRYAEELGLADDECRYLFSEVPVSANTYSHKDYKINVLYGDGSLCDIAEASDMLDISMLSKQVKKYYYCYLKV